MCIMRYALPRRTQLCWTIIPLRRWIPTFSRVASHAELCQVHPSSPLDNSLFRLSPDIMSKERDCTPTVCFPKQFHLTSPPNHSSPFIINSYYFFLHISPKFRFISLLLFSRTLISRGRSYGGRASTSQDVRCGGWTCGWTDQLIPQG